MKKIIGLKILSFIVLSSVATADIELKFGPEFTFQAPSGNIYGALSEYKNHLLNHLVNNQMPAAKFEYDILWDKFTSPNGWTLTPMTDHGVIEVTMDPLTVSDWEKYASDIQDAVFISAYNLGYYPGLYLGGGHINVDLQPFFKNPILLRNFIVDFWNHNELALGIMNYDGNNAASTSMMNPTTIEKLSETLSGFDEFLKGSKRRHTPDNIIDWLQELDKVTSNGKSWIARSWRRSSILSKYIDLYLGDTHNNRIEIRPVRAQKDIYTWINQIKLIQGRINFLEKKGNELIPLRFGLTVQVPTSVEQKAKFKLDPPVQAKEALRQFYIYVTESGQKWEDHRDYIWPKWIKNGSLKRFEKSKWFLERQNCGALL